MFDDLDDTLETILNDAAAPIELRNAAVSFETPDRNFTPAQTTVNLFLFEVKENRELRDPVPITELVAGNFIRRRPPLRVDCMYLVTAWSSQPGAARVSAEHRLLAQALLWLSRFPTVPEAFLQGSLAGQPFPPPTLVAQMNNEKNMGEFWTALGNPPRPGFYLVVTIAMDLAREVSGELVTTKITGYRQTDKPETEEVFITIGGRVLTPEAMPNPIAGARVVIDNLMATTTDADGHFVVDNLAAGSHALRASATGFKAGSKTITVPGPLEEYEIKLDKV